jgi:hypothetical protein
VPDAPPPADHIQLSDCVIAIPPGIGQHHVITGNGSLPSYTAVRCLDQPDRLYCQGIDDRRENLQQYASMAGERVSRRFPRTGQVERYHRINVDN